MAPNPGLRVISAPKIKRRNDGEICKPSPKSEEGHVGVVIAKRASA